MRIARPVFLAVLIAGAFFYFTTYRSHPLNLHPSAWISQPTKLEITQAANNDSSDPEEQNNINIYRKNIA